ncbi:hypothetical protein VV01_21535 [Luteipulveratus halotolerans]|uniref:CAAX prenyl protease 2/Lysostaphin resistance protein A-like domain-containing protein n=1 Tax=Luteipulveratus halotolerans TaxID=1631356 RepID=A0A0L6CDH1_9MICO|nr:hypothetical protein VV01_21535 [Luteipulveratus halotolerans]
MCLALLLTPTAYAVSYGLGVLASVVILRDGYGAGTSASTMADGPLLLSECVLIGLGLLLAGCAAGALGRSALREWAVGRRPRRPGAGALAAGLVTVANLVGFWLFAWINPPEPPQDPATHALWYDLIRPMVSGALGEELIVLALPVIVIRRTAPRFLQRPRSLVLVLGALVLMRLAYHLYQGVWAGSHLPWAVAAVLLYRWTGRVWPQIAAHAFWDTGVALRDHEVLTHAQEMCLFSVFGAATVMIGAGVCLHDRRRRQTRQCSLRGGEQLGAEHVAFPEPERTALDP